MAFVYASGCYQTGEGKPASAFTRGDLLTLTSGSSLSRINELMVSGNDIVGVALANSNQSIDGKVPYLIPEPNTTFWASLHTATTSLFTVGLELDVSYGIPNGGQFVTTSATSARVVIVKGNGGDTPIDQSVESRVLVRLISNAGNLDLS